MAFKLVLIDRVCLAEIIFLTLQLFQCQQKIKLILITTQNLETTTPSVTICTRHRLLLLDIFCASSYMNDSKFLAKINPEDPTNKLIATELFGNTLLI